MEHENDGDTRNDLQKLGEGARKVGNRKKRRDRPNYSLVKIDQNTEKSPGDLMKHAVTQSQWKTIS